MPNWCENRVYIEAPSEDIQAILMSVDNDGEKGLLNYLRPEPEYPADDVKDAMPNWWTWRIENWGTKWEVQAEVISLDVEGGWINLAFESAWSPPIEAFYAWESSGKDRIFNIRFVEWGMMFCGEADSRGINESCEIPTTVAEVQLVIPTELDEEFGITELVAQWEEEEKEEQAEA
jgi:hypothetical protein